MKIVLGVLVVVMIAILGVACFNYLMLTQPTKNLLEQDYRNEGIELNVHFKDYARTNILVFDLMDVSQDKAPVDVFRVFLTTASALKSRKFELVELAFKGQPKFVLSGDYFTQLGTEFGDQNPVYTARTFPENLYNINGKSAYETWEGGMLGVINKQLEDFNDFHSKWYMEDLSSELQK